MAASLNPDANAAVRAAIDRAIAERGEIGIQVAAYHRGQLVIDTWGGIADPATGRPVDGDTLFNVFSVTKAVAATAIHIQAEKGLLDYDAPIADYWPEWGCNGKEKATVRDALTHRTGTPQMPEGTTPESICDWDATVAAIAGLRPLFPVGSVPAYQSLSFGWILGEIVRRTDPARRPFRGVHPGRVVRAPRHRRSLGGHSRRRRGPCRQAGERRCQGSQAARRFPVCQVVTQYCSADS